MQNAPTKEIFQSIFDKNREKHPQKILHFSWLDSPLGPILTIGDEELLYLVEFIDRKNLEQQINQLVEETRSIIIPGRPSSVQSIHIELEKYFSENLREFHTPLFISGSPFQKSVWKELQHIPYGKTESYAALARAIGKPSACRAVAQANGKNRLALIIPCHRVIHANGGYGGYAGGTSKKNWLLSFERTRIHEWEGRGS